MELNDMDYVGHLEDEIALEGLDGITVTALWLRLESRPYFLNSMLDIHGKSFLWSLICMDENIKIFELPKPRKPLVIFNRYAHLDQELGLIIDPEDVPFDIYPYHPVDNVATGERGSCATYNTRTDVTKEVSSLPLKTVLYRFGEKLVLVANQKLRNQALGIDKLVDHFYDLNLIQYGILERIGRSRQMGEVTVGSVSLSALGEAPKSLFYYQKRLFKLKLITKQSHYSRRQVGITAKGSLQHLTRFYVERRSKYDILICRAVEILKAQPDMTCSMNDMRNDLGIGVQACKKLFKTSSMKNVVQTTLILKETDSIASPSSIETSSSKMERKRPVRAWKLVDTQIDPLNHLKIEDETVEDEDEEETGILDQSKLVWGVSLLRQAYVKIESAGTAGLSQTELGRLLGQTKLETRTICRNLTKRQVVQSVLKDNGRQRVGRFVTRNCKVHPSGQMASEIGNVSCLLGVESRTEVLVGEKDSVMTSNEKCASAMKNIVTTKKTVDARKANGKSVKKTVELAAVERGEASTSESIICDSYKESNSLKASEISTNLSNQSISCNLDDTVEVEFHYPSDSLKKAFVYVTGRTKARAGMIMKYLQVNRVVAELFQITKMIREEETKQNLDGLMDRKSLVRLIDRMACEGTVKTFKVTLRTDNRSLCKQVVTHNSVMPDDALLAVAIEHQKLKFLSQKSAHKMQKEINYKNPAIQLLDMEGTEQFLLTISAEELRQLYLPPPDTDMEKKTIVNKGVGPKFLRMREFHQLLFYLVYGYDGDHTLDQEEAWNSIFASNAEIHSTNEDWHQFPTVFQRNLGWSMFIPPLPSYIPHHPGWVFLCDAILRIPLSMFMRVASSCSPDSPEVSEYLLHPVKRHLLLKHLPDNVRLPLLQRRKFIDYVMELTRRLCFAGLLQFGKQWNLQREQVFVYVNRHSSLLDTTISGPGYHLISADKEYTRQNYTFESLGDIKKYWYDLHMHSINTPLGINMTGENVKVTLQYLNFKPAMLQALKPQTQAEAVANDTGAVPGDNQGAAGLDSAFFAHLKRNWNASSYSGKRRITPGVVAGSSALSKTEPFMEGTSQYCQYLLNTSEPQDATMLNASTSNLPSYYKTHVTSNKKRVKVAVAFVPRLPRGKKQSKRKRNFVGIDNSSKAEKVCRSLTSRYHPYQRLMRARKVGPRKPYYDEEDRAALQRMSKLRVDWSSAEDSVLLLCKVANSYLFNHRQVLLLKTVRDILHSRLPTSRMKTSRACQRRINYVLKNNETAVSVAVVLEEIKQDTVFTSKFKVPTIPKNQKNLDNILSKLFRDVVDYLYVKFGSNVGRNDPSIPATLAQFQDGFQLIRTSSSLRPKCQVLQELKSTEDIQFHMLNVLIYSNLCSKVDRESFSYQFYQVYDQYPKSLLHKVLSSMRKDQLISYKKCYQNAPSRDCLPLSTSTFQLSITYLQRFTFKYQFEVFHQSWLLMKQLAENQQKRFLRGREDDELDGKSQDTHGGVPVIIHNEGGYCAALVALMATDRLVFHTEMPDQIIRMDQSFCGEEGVVKESEDGSIQEGLAQEKFTLGDENLLGKAKKLVKNLHDAGDVESAEETETAVEEMNIKTDCNIMDMESLRGSKRKMKEDLNSQKHTRTEPSDGNINASNVAVLNKKFTMVATDKQQPTVASLASNVSSSSRLALYVLRDNCDKLNLIDDDLSQVNIQHFQDNLVINTCDMWCHLCPPHTGFSNTDSNTLDDLDCSLHEDTYLPLVQANVQSALEQRRSVLEDLSTHRVIIVNAWSDIDIALSQLKKSGFDTSHLKFARRVYNCIDDGKEFGLSASELQMQFRGEKKFCISKVVKGLEDSAAIVRVGVTEFRWVTMSHSRPWLIHTARLVRCDREIHPMRSCLFSVSSTEDGQKTKQRSELTQSPIPPLKLNTEQVVDEQIAERKEENCSAEDVKVERTCDTSGDALVRRSSRLSQKRVFEAASNNYQSSPIPGVIIDNLSVISASSLRKRKGTNYYSQQGSVANIDEVIGSKTQEEMAVNIRPWNRINGTLNRRVLDRLMGAVLCLVMERPGVTGKAVGERFSPALLPAHTQELLATLVSIECVEATRVVTSHTASLFSPPTDYSVATVENVEMNDSDVFYEATADAILKMGIFIGDKKYSLDFLASGRRM